MRLVVQRVSEASCTVDGKVTGAIGLGFMVLVGFCDGDTKEIIDKMANKLKKLRVFDDADGKMNLALKDVGGDILSISQFTLYADCSKGNRPSFCNAMKGEKATKMYDYFNEVLAEDYKVEKGIFGADMKIKLLNDGPITIIMDSKEML